MSGDDLEVITYCAVAQPNRGTGRVTLPIHLAPCSGFSWGRQTAPLCTHLVLFSLV